MRLLVTGRNGQLARSLAGLAETWPGIELEFAARPLVDLERPGSVAAAIADAHPDAVINAAAFTDVDRAEEQRRLAFRINAEAAGEAAEATARLGVPIVQLSTNYVFDGKASGPYAEDAPTGPINVYGASKLAGEEAVRDANPQHVIIRTSWLFSPFGRNFVTTMLRLAAERDEIPVVDDQLGSPTSALDVARALRRIVQRWVAGEQLELGQTYHVANGSMTSWCGLARQVMVDARSRGLPAANIRPISSVDWAAPAARPMNSRLNACRFEAEFGHVMPDWRAAVAETVDRMAQAS